MLGALLATTTQNVHTEAIAVNDFQVVKLTYYLPGLCTSRSYSRNPRWSRLTRTCLSISRSRKPRKKRSCLSIEMSCPSIERSYPSVQRSCPSVQRSCPSIQRSKRPQTYNYIPPTFEILLNKTGLKYPSLLWKIKFLFCILKLSYLFILRYGVSWGEANGE